MKLLKNICILIVVCGFVIALGTAGLSDFEYETNQILMTDAQFYLRMFISILMFIGGALGIRICNIISKRKKQYRAVHEMYKVHKDTI